MTKNDRKGDYSALVGIVVATSTYILVSHFVPSYSEWLIGLIGGIVGLSVSLVVLLVLKARRKQT